MYNIPMSMRELKDKWKKFASDMNQKGIPMPTIRDPKTGFGSISLTLVFISSVIVIAGIIGKSAGVLGGLDMSSAMEFFWTATSLYFGRQFQTKSGAIFGNQDSSSQTSGRPRVDAQPPQSPQGPPRERQPKVDDPDA